LQITNIVNVYPSIFLQREFVTVHVSSPTGRTVNDGQVVSFIIQGHQFSQRVDQSGNATVEIDTPFAFDFPTLLAFFFPHTVTAQFSDSGGPFMPSSATAQDQAILIDFLFSLLRGQQQSGVPQFVV
jgi:hypothetical protein